MKYTVNGHPNFIFFYFRIMAVIVSPKMVSTLLKFNIYGDKGWIKTQNLLLWIRVIDFLQITTVPRHLLSAVVILYKHLKKVGWVLVIIVLFSTPHKYIIRFGKRIECKSPKDKGFGEPHDTAETRLAAIRACFSEQTSQDLNHISPYNKAQPVNSIHGSNILKYWQDSHYLICIEVYDASSIRGKQPKSVI